MFSSVSLTFSFPPPLQSFNQPFFASSLAFVFSSLFSSHNYLSPPRLSPSPLPSFPPSLLCLPFFSSTISSIYLSFIYILTFLYLPFLSEPSSLMFSFIHHPSSISPSPLPSLAPLPWDSKSHLPSSSALRTPRWTNGQSSPPNDVLIPSNFYLPSIMKF